jgi:hypothetical protein
MKNDFRIPFTQIFVGRFSFLLVSIILVFALRPFLKGFVRIDILTEIFLSIVLLSAIHAVSRKTRTFITALVLAVPAFSLDWLGYIMAVPSLADASRMMSALFTAYVLIILLSFVLKQKEVTTDVLMAAMCGYFFLGFMWAFFFLFLEAVQPGSFQMAQGQSADAGQFLYFSFVTMTTLGYGDMTPIASGARSLAVLSAVMGQLYLAVTIARLVGMHISQSQK